MSKSIKTRIIALFILIFVGGIISIMLFNTLFLERMYINEKKNILIQTYSALDKVIMRAIKNGYDLEDIFNKDNKQADSGLNNAYEYKRERNDINEINGNVNNFQTFLRDINTNFNVSIILMDKNDHIYSLYQDNRVFDKKMMFYILGNENNNENIKLLEENENWTMVINQNMYANITRPKGVMEGGPTQYEENEGPSKNQKNPTSNRRLPFQGGQDRGAIECFGFLSDESTSFFMFIPYASIKEPIKLFNNILVMTSFIIILIGSIIIYYVANKITLPLRNLTTLSKKMSNLQFEYKYEGDRVDEIGVLGNSMNEMSNKLEKAITGLKNANVKLRKDLKQKEEIDLMRQEFVANVSHELKTPIALIEGYAEGLELPQVLEDKSQREYYVNVIKDEANKMSKMVYNLLDLASLERGTYELDIKRINLFDIVCGVIKSESIKLEEKEIKLYNLINKDTYVWADDFKTEEIIRNYLTNAINHVDEHKVIKIYTENAENEKIRLVVYNSGTSLNETERNKIWEKFYKVDKARTRAYGGTGLGLSIVKAIANEHMTTCGCRPVNPNKNENALEGIEFYFDFGIK